MTNMGVYRKFGNSRIFLVGSFEYKPWSHEVEFTLQFINLFIDISMWNSHIKTSVKPYMKNPISLYKGDQFHVLFGEGES